jgi:hypothetical protein
MKEEFEDTKGEIRIPKLKKDRQHNGQMKKNKRTNNVLQNTTQKTKDVTVTFVAVIVDTTISNTFCQMCIHVLVSMMFTIWDLQYL